MAVRTKAMKCLTQIVDSDPGVLARNDTQLGVHHSFLHQSTSVREASVDLVGKFKFHLGCFGMNFFNFINFICALADTFLKFLIWQQRTASLFVASL